MRGSGSGLTNPAGAAILPAVFAFSMEPGQGPGLIFGTLPKAFQQLAGGPVFGALFFLLIFFAAITSAIALLECLVAFVTQTFRIKRGKAMWLTALAVFLMGIPSGLSFGALKNVTILHYSIFDFMVVLTDHILLPIIGLSLCIFVGWFWGPAKLIAEMQEGGVTFRLKKAWVFCIRYIAPVLITLVTVMGFLEIIGTAAG